MKKTIFGLIGIFILGMFFVSLVIAISEGSNGGLIEEEQTEQIGDEPQVIELGALFNGFKDDGTNEKVKITNAEIVRTTGQVKIIFRAGGEMTSRTEEEGVMNPDATRFYDFGKFDSSKEAYVIFNNNGELIEAEFTVAKTKFNGKIPPPKDCYFNNRKISLSEETEVSFRGGEQSDNLDLIVPDGTHLNFAKDSKSYSKNLIIKYTPEERGEFLWKGHYFEKGSLTYNSDQDYLELKEKTLIMHFTLGSLEIDPGNGIELVSPFEKLNPSGDYFSLKPIKNSDGEIISSEIQINSNTGNEIKVKATSEGVSFPYLRKENNLNFQVGGDGKPGSLHILPQYEVKDRREIIAEGEFIVRNGDISNFVREGELHSQRVAGANLKEEGHIAYPIRITYPHREVQVEYLPNGLMNAYAGVTKYSTSDQGDPRLVETYAKSDEAPR